MGVWTPGLPGAIVFCLQSEIVGRCCLCVCVWCVCVCVCACTHACLLCAYASTTERHADRCRQTDRLPEAGTPMHVSVQCPLHAIKLIRAAVISCEIARTLLHVIYRWVFRASHFVCWGGQAAVVAADTAKVSRVCNLAQHACRHLIQCRHPSARQIPRVRTAV